MASSTEFKMERAVFSVSEGKHGLGWFSCGKQQRIGNVQDSGGFLKGRLDVMDTDEKSGVVNSSFSQQLKHHLRVKHSEGT